MIIESQETREFILTLTAAEAAWLKDYMQNPKSDVETQEEENNRAKLFHGLKSVGA